MKTIWLVLTAGWLTLCLAACAAGNVMSADVSSSHAPSSDVSLMDVSSTDASSADVSFSGVPSMTASSTAASSAALSSLGASSALVSSVPVEVPPTPSSGGSVVSTSVSQGGATADTESKAAAASSTEPVEPAPSQEEEEPFAMEETIFYVTVGDTVFAADFADNPGAQAFRELLAAGPVTLSMSDYGGFEKVGGLGQSLPASDAQTVTQAGDIVLYQGNQIVLFYGSNSWSYTRLGNIRDRTGWENALGRGSVSVRFSLTE